LYIIQAAINQEITKWKNIPACGYEYDPEAGDPDSGIAICTCLFEDIPDDLKNPFVLPKEQFELGKQQFSQLRLDQQLAIWS